MSYIWIGSKQSPIRSVIIGLMGSALYKPRPTRLFRFGLRALLLFVLIVSLLLSWVIHTVRQPRIALAALEKTGSEFSSWSDTNEQPTILERVGSLLGERGSSEALQIIGGPRFTDAEMAHLQKFSHLKYLHLNGTQVTDAGLAQLQPLTQLVVLNLRGTRTSDAGIMHIRDLTQLAVLYLDDTTVSDAGLVHLRRLIELGQLELNDTNVGDAGVRHLRGLTRLSTLSLEGTHLTDAGLGHLRGLSHLEYLHLERTHVSDAGVQRLRKSLPKCKITH